MGTPYGVSDKDYNDYVNSKNNAGQVTQGIFNSFSNPFGNLGRNNYAANTNSDFQWMNSFSNPFGINFTGGQGGWNQDLAQNKDVFQSMNDEDWAEFSKMGSKDQSNWVAKRKAELPKRKAQSDAEKAQKDEAEKRKGAENDIISKLRAFADEMNMPIEQLLQKDEFAKALQAHTTNTALTGAAGRGLGPGGISTQNADYTSKKALLGYQMQRQQMGQQAENQAFGMINNQGLRAEDLRRYNQGLDLQQQQADAARKYQMYLQGVGQAGQTMGMVGGVIGGIYGGAAGATAGQKVGSSFGEYQYQQNNGYNPYSYKAPSGVYSQGGNNTGGGNY
jgi:hypothetical protein